MTANSGSGGLRADAERNRISVVRAAREAFATEGIDVSMAEIARRAGVGFATAQRRFPTKRSLIAEVVRAQLDNIEELAPCTAEGDEADDPWEAFTAPVRACCAQQALAPGLAASLAQVLSARSDPGIRRAITDVFERLATRAKSAGSLRADVTVDDVLLVLKGNAGVVENSTGCEGESSQRFVELALHSLRA